MLLWKNGAYRTTGKKKDSRLRFEILNDVKLFLKEQQKNRNLAAGVQEVHDVFREERILAWGGLVVNYLRASKENAKVERSQWEGVRDCCIDVYSNELQHYYR